MSAAETEEKLTYMVNQIARNFAVRGEDAAVAATAEHIKLFWDPRMIAAITGGDQEDISSIARQAVERLRD